MTGRKVGAVRIAGRGEQRLAPSAYVAGWVWSVLVAAGDAGRNHRRRRGRAGERDDAIPVDGLGEGAADLGLVERRHVRVEAVVGDAEAVRLAQLRPKVRVVRDPRRVARADAGVVELALVEQLRRRSRRP